MRGFSNRRTLDTLIAHELYEVARHNVSFFYPMYFINKRDNTKIAKDIEEDDLRVIALFSNRPKTEFIGSNHIEVSFRESLLYQVDPLVNIGIPCLSGCPITSDLKGLSFGSTIQWFKLNKSTDTHYMRLAKDNSSIKIVNPTNSITSVNSETILQTMKSQSTMTWNEILQLIQDWYQVYRSPSLFQSGSNIFNNYFMSAQRPLFIIYRINRDKL